MSTSVILHDFVPRLEALLEVLVLFEKSSIVYNDLSVGNAQFKNLVVHRFGRFHCSYGFLEVDIERPQLERFEEAGLSRKRLLSSPVSLRNMNPISINGHDHDS